MKSVVAVILLSAAACETGTRVFRAGVRIDAPKSDNYDAVISGTAPDATALNIDADDGTSVTLVGTCRFTGNLGFDILASLPFSHDLDATVSNGELGTCRRLSPFRPLRNPMPPVSPISASGSTGRPSSIRN